MSDARRAMRGARIPGAGSRVARRGACIPKGSRRRASCGAQHEQFFLRVARRASLPRPGCTLSSPTSASPLARFARARASPPSPCRASLVVRRTLHRFGIFRRFPALPLDRGGGCEPGARNARGATESDAEPSHGVSTMTRPPARAHRRATFLAAVALPLAVMAGLTAGHLTRGAPSPRVGLLGGDRSRAYGEAPPPQTLAITADFFEALEIDPRAETPAQRKAPPRVTDRVAEQRCTPPAPAMATAETPHLTTPADSTPRLAPRNGMAVADARGDTALESSLPTTPRPPAPAVATPTARQRSSSSAR